MFKFLDAYTIRARLFPALIAAAPALAALALLISWHRFALSNVIATGALLVILYALSDFARKAGKRIEPRVYEELGGKPSVAMMRYRDASFDAVAKDRYRTLLAEKSRIAAPTDADEQADPAAADAVYDQYGTWLRENTRDTKKFPILFNENVTYGFRRNLFALKWPALGLNVLVVLLCLGLLWRWAPINPEDDLTGRVIVILVIAAIHAAYIALVVSKQGLIDASRTYARQLILSSEAFFSDGKRAASARGKAKAK
jgi:hypothetical protein